MEQTISKSQDQKLEFWKHHIDQCHQSGLSQRHYCQANNLALSTLGYWKRKLSREPEAPIQFYPLVLPDDSRTSLHAGLTLRLKEKRFGIEIAENFSSSTLKKLITTLEQF